MDKRALADMFDIHVERRMRVAIFVQTLYERSPNLPNISETEALEKLRDVNFLREMTNLLISYYIKTGDQEELDKVWFLFGVDEEE